MGVQRMKRATVQNTRKLSEDSGELAEELVGEHYSNYSVFGVENFDVSTDSGKLGEVKSCYTELDSGASGRLRLWQSQHEKLLKADREGTARYVFVLFDVSQRPPKARMKEKIPSEMGHIVGARGGWGPSGHSSEGLQYKLPYEVVFDG